MKRVRDLMSRHLQVIDRNTPAAEVLNILEEGHITGAPLMDLQGQVCGIISKSDIVHFELGGGDVNEALAWEVGAPRVLTVREDSGLQAAAGIMLRKHVHRLLVVDADGGPVGMLSSFDFVRLVAESPPK